MLMVSCSRKCSQRAHQAALLNYRRDGSPHWVLLHLAPVFHAADGRVLHFLAVQVPIAVAACGPAPPPRCCSPRAARRPGSRSISRARPTPGRCSWIWIRELAVAGLEAEEPRVASESEKEKAVSTANNIFSVLNRYSKITGLVVCGKRCDSFGIPALSSSLNLSLGRIKQSFVLTDRRLPDMPIIYASDVFLSLTGLQVAIKCKNSNGEYESKAVGELDGSGAFAVPLAADFRSADCLAQLHSAVGVPCPGQEPSRILPMADGTLVAVAGKAQYASPECASATICDDHKKHLSDHFHKDPDHEHHHFFDHFHKKPAPPTPEPEYHPPTPTYGGSPTPIYHPPTQHLAEHDR